MNEYQELAQFIHGIRVALDHLSSVLLQRSLVGVILLLFNLCDKAPDHYLWAKALSKRFEFSVDG